jgi:ABC-type lipoprotein export system ATPase subunit
MLELTNVCKHYPGDDKYEVLHNISLYVEPGQTLSIAGPSGSGKSTLLNLIGGLDRPTSGTISLDNQNLAMFSDNELAGFRNRKIGFVFQLHHLLPQCTVLENVLLPTLAARRTTEEHITFQRRADALLEKVSLTDKRNNFPGQLSGGQRQRVALIRALICKPSIVLADEPTGSLDADNAEQIAELLLALNKIEGTTLIVATHAASLANRMQRRFRLDHQHLTELSERSQ